jgi:serine/threonine protein kinase
MAIKLISHDINESVEREIGNVVKLDHPNIINYYGREIDASK